MTCWRLPWRGAHSKTKDARVLLPPSPPGPGDIKGITMSTIIRKNFIASFCFFALLFAAAAGIVDAQADNPIEEDDIIATVPVGDDVWVTPLALKTELEVATGKTATVESMSSLLARLPFATRTNGVRFEGGVPAMAVQNDLYDLGYATQMNIATPSVPGAIVAVRRSL